MAPAPAEGQIDGDFEPVMPIAARSVRTSSTQSRYEEPADTERDLAYTLRSFVRPHTGYSLLATLVFCTLLVLLVGVPYALNERMADANPVLQTAMRGLILGIGSCFVLGAIFLVTTPTVVRGGFHLRYLLSLPVTLGSAVGVAFIPVEGSTLGVISISLLTIGISYLLCFLLLNAPFFATNEHKALTRSFGPPLLSISILFFGLIAAHVTLTQRFSSPWIGLLLPAGSAVIRKLAIFAMGYSFHTFYFLPMAGFLLALSLSTQSRQGVVPPLLGDVEAVYSYAVAMFALIIGNAALVSSIVEATLSPDSTAWVLSLIVSSLLEVITRTGVQQRVELWVAAKLAAKFEDQWPMRIVEVSALELVYFHSLGGTGYVAPTMAVCIGFLRAVTFGEPAAIVWLDCSPTVWRVLLMQLASQIVEDAAVWGMKKMGQQFEVSAHFAVGHPLRNTAFRDFGVRGYAFTFSSGVAFIYLAFIAFLGPAFVMGICHDLAPNATHVWVAGGLGCARIAVDSSMPGGVRVANGPS